VITRISGEVRAVRETFLTLGLDAFEYEVLIPDFVRRQLQGRLGEEISLHTVDYLEGDAMRGRLTPRLVGFLNEAERDFFNMFCSVDGVGVRKALRAMVRPVQEIATAIEQQDAKTLSSLPGIGAATAERIVAKLRRKMAKFALLVTHEVPDGDVSSDVVRETFEALRTLGHGEADARRLIDAALAGKKKFKDVQSLLQAIYDQGHGEG